MSMKGTRVGRVGITALFLLLLLLPALQGAGLELSTRFDLGNLGFDPDRASADATYSGTDYYWGGTVEVTHGFSERMALRAGFSRDTVLRNLAYAMLYYNLDYLSMGIGTIQGFNNTDGATLKPGLASSVQLTFPGRHVRPPAVRLPRWAACSWRPATTPRTATSCPSASTCPTPSAR